LPGLWVNGNVSASQLGIVQKVALDYGDQPDYTTYSNVGAVPSGCILMLSIGACSASQASTIGNYLVANGQSDAIIRPMWEYNQDVSGWFTPWNQGSLSAAQYKSTWITIVETMRPISSGFKFFLCPNAGNGNNASGRTTWDVDPGPTYVDIYGLDVYDNNGSVATSVSYVDAAITYAAGQGKPWGIGEWGLAGSDDPTFITDIANLTKDGTCYVQCYFSYAGSINSDITQFPNSLAAYKAAFG
jgi:hypothetical protein